MTRTIHNITERIESLSTEAGQVGDVEMVELCERANGWVLRDDRTGSLIAPEELWVETPVVYYVRAIVDSLDAASEAGTLHGVIHVQAREVYATSA